MGRIKTDGMILVDLPEAQELLGKSRATLFRMIRDGRLTKLRVSGYQESFVTLESVERCQGPQMALKMLDDDSVREERKTELRKRFPHVFTSLQDQCDRPRSHQNGPDRLPSAVE